MRVSNIELYYLNLSLMAPQETTSTARHIETEASLAKVVLGINRILEHSALLLNMSEVRDGDRSSCWVLVRN